MTIKDVENLAELARIELSEEEKQSLLLDMEGILAYIKQIEEVKLDEVNPKYEHYNSWREDEGIEREFSKDLIIGQFPNSQDNFLKVKKIL
jgi:aspartyl-tRNA(Asn)/glutamyl-tRNA(Gln) amidotransferase subunit C